MPKLSEEDEKKVRGWWTHAMKQEKWQEVGKPDDLLPSDEITNYQLVFKHIPDRLGHETNRENLHLCVDIVRNGFHKMVQRFFACDIVQYNMACCGLVELQGFYAQIHPLFSDVLKSLPGVYRNRGLFLAITSNAYQRNFEPAFEAAGWKAEEFYNPNSGNRCKLWKFINNQQ